MQLPHFTPDRAGASSRAREALDAFDRLALPLEKDEAWRYTDVEHLDLSPFAPMRGEISVEGADTDDFGEGAGLVDADQDVFAAMSLAFGGGAKLTLSGTERNVVHVEMGTGDASAAHLPLLHVQCTPGSESVVVVRHTGEAGFSAPLIEVDIGDDARLHLVDVQELGPHVIHIATTRLRLGRASALDSVAVGLGAKLSRLRLETDLSGAGAESDMLGLYFGDGEQHFDNRTWQKHLAERCRSDVHYNGAVADHARAVFLGLIYVGREGRKTDAGLTNRNLILSEGASAYAKPELEILNSDIIRCNHAAAVGPVDEDQRYYLESRGLDPDVARRLIIFGFFEEVLRRIPDRAVEAGLRLAVGEKFRRAEEALVIR